MLKLFYEILNSEPAKVLARFIASLASAIIVINGFIFFASLNQKPRTSVEEPYNKEELNEEAHERTF